MLDKNTLAEMSFSQIVAAVLELQQENLTLRNEGKDKLKTVVGQPSEMLTGTNTAQSANLVHDNQLLRDEVLSLNNTLSDARYEVKIHRDNAEDRYKETVELSNTRNYLNREVNKLKATIANLSEELSAAKSVDTVSRTLIHNLHQINSDAEITISSLDKKLAAADQTVLELEDKNTKLKAMCDELAILAARGSNDFVITVEQARAKYATLNNSVGTPPHDPLTEIGLMHCIHRMSTTGNCQPPNRKAWNEAYSLLYSNLSELSN